MLEKYFLVYVNLNLICCFIFPLVRSEGSKRCCLSCWGFGALDYSDRLLITVDLRWFSKSSLKPDINSAKIFIDR